MAFLTDSSPAEACTDPWTATFGLRGAGAGVLVGEGAGVGVDGGIVVGDAAWVAVSVTGSDAGGLSGPDRVAQDVETASNSSKPARVTAILIGGSFDRTCWRCRWLGGLAEDSSRGSTGWTRRSDEPSGGSSRSNHVDCTILVTGGVDVALLVFTNAAYREAGVCEERAVPCQFSCAC